MSDEAIRFAYDWYLIGYSVSEIAEQVWEHYGYASALSCQMALYQAFKRRALPMYQHDGYRPETRREHELRTEFALSC